jgi:predicted AlkP superfamily pyrophosphatase or phosphodiesterase
MSRWTQRHRFAILLALGLACAVPSAQRRTNLAPILILISFDGWRADYFDRVPAPNLHALAALGVHANGLIPSFPALTFPNHYTIVTGLYPAHHGIIANTMRDPSIPDRFSMSAETAKDARWWGGEPIWATAIRQGLRAATMFWPGEEVAIGGVRPTYWKPYDKKFSSTDRVTQALAWLALPDAERPSFVSLYFDEVDTAGHDFGVASPELVTAAAHLDAALGQLVAGVTRLGLEAHTSIVVVSDHGMTPLSYDRLIFLDALIDLSTVDVTEWGGLLFATPRDGDVDGLYRRLHGKHPALAIYKREQLPSRLHFRDNPRIPPIIGIPDNGWAVTSGQRVTEKELDAGTHGYDPANRDMQALFVAAGPTLRRGLVVAAFENIHVYDLLCKLLKITPARNDGSAGATRGFFR